MVVLANASPLRFPVPAVPMALGTACGVIHDGGSCDRDSRVRMRSEVILAWLGLEWNGDDGTMILMIDTNL